MKDKLLIFLINTLLFYIPLLALTDRQNHRQRNKYTCCAWAGGTYFQLCCCVSFLVVAEIVLGDTYLPYQLCRCVFFLRQEIVFGCTGQFFGCGGKKFHLLLPYLPYQLYRCVSFLVAAGNSFWF
jgi:hypothetical protein